MSDDVCSNCGKPLRPGVRYCPGCGKAVPAASADEGPVARGPGESPKPKMEFGSPLAGAPAGMAGLGGMTGGTPQGAGQAPANRAITRLDRVTVVAKWHGALRQLMVDRDAQVFGQATQQVLNAVAPFGEASDIFQNLVFQSLFSLAQTPELVGAANAGLASLPSRFAPYLQDPNSAAALDVDGGWKEIFESWPYSTYLMSWDVAPDVFPEMCVQTVYEGAFVLNLPPNGYLEEEQARVEAGLYPREVALLIRRACSKAENWQKSKDAGWGATSDERADGLVRVIAPQGHPEAMKKLTMEFGAAGIPNPLRQDHLAEWELKHIYAFASGQEYDRSELVEVLKGRWESLAQQATRLADPLYYALQIILQASLVMLAQCLNMQSRRLDAGKHNDFAYALETGPGPQPLDVIRSEMEKNSPELVKALWPETTSLFAAEYLMRKQQPEHPGAGAQNYGASAASSAGGQANERPTVKLKDIPAIIKALKNLRPSLQQGRLSPLDVLNRAFVKGNLGQREFDQAMAGNLLLGKELFFTLEQSLDVAEEPYAWFVEGDAAAAGTVFVALLALSGGHDAYFCNMAGACAQQQDRLNEALAFYDKALTLDPECLQYGYNRANTRVLLGMAAKSPSKIQEGMRELESISRMANKDAKHAEMARRRLEEVRQATA